MDRAGGVLIGGADGEGAMEEAMEGAAGATGVEATATGAVVDTEAVVAGMGSVLSDRVEDV